MRIRNRSGKVETTKIYIDGINYSITEGYESVSYELFPWESIDIYSIITKKQ